MKERRGINLNINYKIIDKKTIKNNRFKKWIRKEKLGDVEPG